MMEDELIDVPVWLAFVIMTDRVFVLKPKILHDVLYFDIYARDTSTSASSYLTTPKQLEAQIVLLESPSINNGKHNAKLIEFLCILK